MANVVSVPWAYSREQRRCDRVLAGINLANQAIAPSADRRNVVELLRVRELREFQRRFANYKADLSNKP